MNNNANNTHKRMKCDQLDNETSTKRVKQSKKLILEVGEERFQTTRETLLKEKDSFFTALLSGNYDGFEEDGSIFIDRDGKLFKQILEYLRSGHITETDTDALMRLITEAEFYHLTELTLMLKKALGLIDVNGKEILAYEVKLDQIRRVTPYIQEGFQYPLKHGGGMFLGDFTVVKTADKWGFVTYDRILSDVGSGTVIGEYENDLWVHLDLDPGASRWKGSSKDDLVNKHGFRLLMQMDTK